MVIQIYFLLLRVLCLSELVMSRTYICTAEFENTGQLAVPLDFYPRSIEYSIELNVLIPSEMFVLTSPGCVRNVVLKWS